MKTDLRFTDTNAASNSKGRTWGLEGGLFWWLVGGVGVGVTVFFVLLVILKSSLLTSFAVALLDAQGNGVVLSSLHGRADTRIFAKQVQAGRSKHALSDEEQDAIRKALSPAGA